MNISAIKTHKITTKDKSIFDVIDQHIPTLSENSILVITSKIISIVQGRVVAMKKVDEVGKVEIVDKDALIKQESQFFLPRNENPYNVSLTITNNTLIASAGIDESNGNGYYILWPEDVQQVANSVREHVVKKFNLKNVGVLITDSKTTPLRWGVTALALAYCGFLPLKDYIGMPDIFGKNLEYTKMNIADNLSCASALVMGEGNEQTPLAIVKNPPVLFVDRNPSKEELKSLSISLNEDLYGPILKSAKWIQGKAS